MRAGLDNAASFEHIDPVCMHDGGKAMGNQDRNQVFSNGNVPDGIRDLFLRQRIEG